MLTAIVARRRLGPVILLSRGRSTVSITFSERYPRPLLIAAEAILRTSLRVAVRRADHVIAVSSEVAGQFGKKPAFIAPEVDWDALVQCPTGGPRELDLALFVGRLELEKGPELAIRAAAAAPGIDRLVVVGSGVLRAHLGKVADEVRSSLRVEFISAAPHQEVLGLCQRASVLLAPSSSEGFGLAAFEAVAMGAAVVASQVGGLPEAVGGFAADVGASRVRLLASRSASDWAAQIAQTVPGERQTIADLKELRERQGWWTLGEVIDHVSASQNEAFRRSTGA
jgi:glycosyltransferase involved in cell wall biosynthesis